MLEIDLKEIMEKQDWETLRKAYIKMTQRQLMDFRFKHNTDYNWFNRKCRNCFGKVAVLPVLWIHNELAWFCSSGQHGYTQQEVEKLEVIPMKLGDYFESRYLKAADIDDLPETLTIKAVEEEEIRNQDKLVVYFEEVTKGLVLNKTNGERIGKLLGEETDSWVGHKIGLKQVETDFGGEMVDAIRVVIVDGKAAVKKKGESSRLKPAGSHVYKDSQLNKFMDKVTYAEKNRN